MPEFGEAYGYSKREAGAVQIMKTVRLNSHVRKAQGDWKIKVSLPYTRYKQRVKEKLRSKEGYALAVQRMIEPESMFGQIKNNCSQFA